MEELTTAERQRRCWGTAPCRVPESFLWSLDFGLLGSRERLCCMDNYSGPESCFVFVVFAFKIKVSIILKIVQRTYQLTKKN